MEMFQYLTRIERININLNIQKSFIIRSEVDQKQEGAEKKRPNREKETKPRTMK
jgi:hypothetical protein